MANDVEAGTDHLRLAADRVRVLHVFAIEVRLANIAAAHQLPQDARDRGLPAVPAHAVNAAIERRVAALDRVSGHGAGYQRRREHVLAAEYRRERKRGRYLRTVQQREAFLGREPDRHDTGVREGLLRRHQFAVYPRLADADQHARHVRERRQVARGADRALGRYPRIDVVIDQRAQRVDQLEPYAGETLGQRDDFHQHDQAHDVVAEVLPDTDRMRAHEILLQLHEFVVADVDARELAEAGVDAVNLSAALDDVADVFGGLRDGAARVDAERDLDGSVPCLAQLGKRHELLVDDEFHEGSPRPIIGRLRPCSRAHAIASG